MPISSILPRSALLVPTKRPDRTNMAEKGVLGVVDGAGRVVQGLSGSASMAAEDLLKRADARDATPENQRPQSISDKHKNEPWYKQVYHNIADTFSATPKEQEDRANDFTARISGENRGLLKKIAASAGDIYNDARKTRERINPDLGDTGKTVSFATQLIPGVRAMDTVVSTGENKNIHDGVITAIANRVIPGSAAAAPGVSAAATAAKDLALKVTQQAAPEAVKSARDAVVPPSKTSASMPDPFVEAKSEDKVSPLLKPLKKPVQG